MSFESTQFAFIKKRTGPKGTKYYVRFSAKGKKELFEVLENARTLMDAKKKADERIREYLNEKSVFHQKKVLFEDFVPRVLAMQESKVKVQTYRKIKGILKRLAIQFNNTRIDEINAENWSEYVKKRVALGWDVENDHKYMRLTLLRARELGLLTIVPKLEIPRKSEKIGKEFTDDEIARLYRVSDDSLKLRLLIAISTGMRKNEILNIEFKNINTSRSYIDLPKTKTDRPRRVPVSTQIIEKIEELKKTTKSPYLFYQTTDATKPMIPQVHDREWWTARKAAGVKGRFHDLRHSAITRMLRKGYSIFLISKHVGASVKTISKVYEHIQAEDRRDLADAITIEGLNNE